MHEYSIVGAVIARAEREARERGACAVRKLSLRVGELAGVEPALIEAAWTALRPGTLCAGAALAIEAVPLRWECAACGRELAPGRPLQCAPCGAPARLAGGGELLLERIELEAA
jgi:hydrogenase nickel incorporation protein HypA/HybF